MFVVGFIDKEPFGMTEPMPWSMVMVAALAEVQVSVALWPWMMDFGEASMVTAGGWFTITVTDFVSLSHGLAAVMV